jgi:transcriptional regulator with XRE-family HTH domain
MSSLGLTIRSIRNALGMTQAQFADALGYSRTETISDWERGVREPTSETLDQIAKLAGKSAGEIFGAAHAERDVPGDPSLRQVLAELARIEDPLQRVLERESIAAVLRAEALRDACYAARLEAERAPVRALSSASRIARQGARAQDAVRPGRPPVQDAASIARVSRLPRPASERERGRPSTDRG